MGDEYLTWTFAGLSEPIDSELREELDDIFAVAGSSVDIVVFLKTLNECREFLCWLGRQLKIAGSR